MSSLLVHLANLPVKQGSETFDRFVRVCCRAYNILRRCSHEFITLFSLMLSTGIPELQAAVARIAVVRIAIVSRLAYPSCRRPMAILTMALLSMAIRTLQTAEDIDWLRDKTGVYGAEMSEEDASDFFEKQVRLHTIVSVVIVSMAG